MLYNEEFIKLAKNTPKLNFILEEIKDIRNIKILELGVREGVSTSMFLKLCEENEGKLISVDIKNYSELFKNENWNFINARDDEFEKINEEIKKIGGLDVVYIDSFHHPLHVKKVFFNYYRLLNKNGFIFVDDICWLPYAKNSYRQNSWVHELTYKTFEKLLEIKSNNFDNFIIEFSFEDSGTAKIIKKTDKELKEPLPIKKVAPIRNFLQTIYEKIFKKF